MAGASSPQLQTEAEMIKAIREAGRTPVQRNTFYETLRVRESEAPAEAAANGPGAKLLEQNLASA